MQWLSEKILVLMGWEIVGQRPDEPKLVMVGYPHTSNWDLFLLLALASHFDLKVRFLAKAALFRGPLGYFMRRWGGVPVDRSGARSLVDAAVAAFSTHDELILVIAPEGTRSKSSRWKSGFWRIAEAAEVPVVMAFIDGRTKRIGLSAVAKSGGDLDAWMRVAAEFYADKNGLRSANRGPVAL